MLKKTVLYDHCFSSFTLEHSRQRIELLAINDDFSASSPLFCQGQPSFVEKLGLLYNVSDTPCRTKRPTVAASPEPHISSNPGQTLTMEWRWHCWDVYIDDLSVWFRSCKCIWIRWFFSTFHTANPGETNVFTCAKDRVTSNSWFVTFKQRADIFCVMKGDKLSAKPN